MKQATKRVLLNVPQDIYDQVKYYADLRSYPVSIMLRELIQKALPPPEKRVCFCRAGGITVLTTPPKFECPNCKGTTQTAPV